MRGRTESSTGSRWGGKKKTKQVHKGGRPRSRASPSSPSRFLLLSARKKPSLRGRLLARPAARHLFSPLLPPRQGRLLDLKTELPSNALSSKIMAVPSAISAGRSVISGLLERPAGKRARLSLEGREEKRGACAAEGYYF